VPVRRARRLERNDAKPLLDREHARMRVGCGHGSVRHVHRTSNVYAGGPACPYRFRRLGCGHFRTDPSCLPGCVTTQKTVLASSHDAPTNPGCVMLIQSSALPGRFTSEVRHTDLEALTRPSSAQRYSPDFSTATR